MKLVVQAIAAVIVAAAFGSVCAQSYPVKPVRLIVPYPPGGGTDIFARMLGAKLGEVLGQQMVIENRAGAAGVLGAEAAAKAPPDGYTLVVGQASNLAINPHMMSKLPYDPVKDFAPITLLAVAPMIVGVNQAAPITSVQELIKLAKARPGTLKYATAGSGSPMHMGGEIFKDVAGVDLLHVPYSGGGPALISLIAGETDIAFDTAASILPQVRAGRIRALAIARASRLAEYPNSPTCAETGLPAYEANAWYSMHAPAGTPPAIIRKINAELVKAMAAPDIVEKLRQLGSDAGGDTPEHFGAFVRAELDKYAKLIKKSGIKVE